MLAQGTPTTDLFIYRCKQKIKYSVNVIRLKGRNSYCLNNFRTTLKFVIFTLFCYVGNPMSGDNLFKWNTFGKFYIFNIHIKKPMNSFKLLFYWPTQFELFIITWPRDVESLVFSKETTSRGPKWKWTSNLFYEQLWSKMVVYGFIYNRYLILDKVLKEYFWLTSKEGFHYQILWTNLLPFLFPNVVSIFSVVIRRYPLTWIVYTICLSIT